MNEWASIYELISSNLQRGRTILTIFILVSGALLVIGGVLGWRRWQTAIILACIIWAALAGAAGFFILTTRSANLYVLRGHLTGQVERGRNAVMEGQSPGHFLELEIEQAFYINEEGRGEDAPTKVGQAEMLTNITVYEALDEVPKPTEVTLIGLDREIIGWYHTGQLIMSNGIFTIR